MPGIIDNTAIQQIIGNIKFEDLMKAQSVSDGIDTSGLVVPGQTRTATLAMKQQNNNNSGNETTPSLFSKMNQSSADAWNGTNGIEKLSTLTSGIGGIVGGFKQASQIQDTSGIDAATRAIGNTNFIAGDNTQLMDNYNNLTFAPMQNGIDLRASDKDQALGLGKSILSGTTMGAKIGGPWGALAGAIVGAGAGVGGIFSGYAKANREADRLNRLAEENNSRALNNFNISANQLSNNNYYNMMKNIAADGGLLFNTNGGVFNPLDIRVINEGGTHEENPNQGVPQGVDPQGVPNLVEEGEVVWNDYVFSNRIKPSKRMINDFKLGNNMKGKSYADIAKKLTKDSEDRPNDPITKRSVELAMQKLMTAQEMQKQRAEMNKMMDQQEQDVQSMFACGGKMKKKRYDLGGLLNQFGYGGPVNMFYRGGHSSNSSNLVFSNDKYVEGESDKYRGVDRDYIVYNDDNTINFDELYKEGSKYMLARQALLGAWDKDDDDSKAMVEAYISNLMAHNPKLKREQITKDYVSKITKDGKYGYGHDLVMDVTAPSTNPTPPQTPPEQTPQQQTDAGTDGQTPPQGPAVQPDPPVDVIGKPVIPFKYDNQERYAPILGSALSTLMYNQPDYTHFNNVENKAYGLNPERISTRPIGEYMQFNPIDENYALNQLRSQNNAQIRALQQNPNAGAVVAGILAGNMNYGNNIGTALQQIRDINDKNRQMVIGQHNDIDKYNSQSGIQVDQFNAQNKAQYDQLMLNTLLQSAAYKQQIKDAAETANSANMSNLFTNIGKLGEDKYNKALTEWLINEKGWAPGVKLDK